MLAVEIETLAGLIASVATLITAIFGGWAIWKQLRHTDSKVDAAGRIAQDVYEQVNGADAPEGEPETLGQVVREMRAQQRAQAQSLAALRRELDV